MTMAKANQQLKQTNDKLVKEKSSAPAGGAGVAMLKERRL